MLYTLNPKYIKAVDVFFERYQTRRYVGRLVRENEKYIFTYQMKYLKEKSSIPLGLEFPLTKIQFESDSLFESFYDRLPDPKNPAYKDYCHIAGIDVTTTDPIILLPTIAKRGPSSFIFEPYYESFFTIETCEQWRKELNFSMQDFAHFFDISLSILQKIKAGKSSGKEIFDRLKSYWMFKNNFIYLLEQNRKWLHPHKITSVNNWMDKHFIGDIMNDASGEHMKNLLQSNQIEDIKIVLESLYRHEKDFQKILRLLPLINKNHIPDVIFKIIDIFNNHDLSKINLTPQDVLQIYDILVMAPEDHPDPNNNMIDPVRRMTLEKYPKMLSDYIIKRVEYILKNEELFPLSAIRESSIIIPYTKEPYTLFEPYDIYSKILTDQEVVQKIKQWIKDHQCENNRYLMIKKLLLVDLLNEKDALSEEEKENIKKNSHLKISQDFLDLEEKHLEYVKKISNDLKYIEDFDQQFFRERTICFLCATRIDALADDLYNLESTKKSFIKALIEKTNNDLFGAVHIKKLKENIEKEIKDDKLLDNLRDFLRLFDDSHFIEHDKINKKFNEFIEENNILQNQSEPLKNTIDKRINNSTYASYVYQFRCDLVHKLDTFNVSFGETLDHQKSVRDIDFHLLIEIYEALIQCLKKSTNSN